MKWRFPLYVKILGWFFLNLVLLATIFYLVLRVQYRFGIGSFIAGQAGERLQALSHVIVAELNDSPPDGWDQVLERFSQGYKVQFLLVRSDGRQLAGEPMTLPPEVRVKLRQPDTPMMPRPRRDSARRPPNTLPTPPPRPHRPPEAPYPKTMVHTKDPSRYWILVRVPIMHPDRSRPLPATLIAASDTLSAGGLFLDFRPWILAGLGVIGLSALFWFPLVQGLTQYVSKMVRATGQIAQGQFDVRIQENRRDELGSLGNAINQLAARLAGFITGQRRFLGDIAHELCSPIARMQVALGIVEQRSDPSIQPHLKDLREEVEEMSSLVNELLSFSKASLNSTAAVRLQPTQLKPLLERAIAREAAAKPGLQLNVSEELTALADPELLVRALSNVLRNAVRYALDAGPVTITAASADDHVFITIADSGPGVPDDALHQIFDPFYRVDQSRTRETGGVGLGLAIVKTCVEACGGTVACRNRTPHGFEVLITLQARRIDGIR